MRVVFIGPPGSGKGTQADLLHERLGVRVIGTGDLLREAIKQRTPSGLQAEPFLAQGKLAPDSLVNAIVAEQLRRPGRPDEFIMDGYPRTVSQAHALDAVLTEQELPLHAVIHFRIDDEEVIRRLSGRGRLDDDDATVRVRLQEFRDTSRELLEYYRKRGILHDVTAVDTKENVYQKIAALMQPAAGT